jgi:hypothetical protein
MLAIGTKPRCESSTGRSGAEDKADVQAPTHHPFVRRRLNHTQALDNFRLSGLGLAVARCASGARQAVRWTREYERLIDGTGRLRANAVEPLENLTAGEASFSRRRVTPDQRGETRRVPEMRPVAA